MKVWPEFLLFYSTRHPAELLLPFSELSPEPFGPPPSSSFVQPSEVFLRPR